MASIMNLIFYRLPPILWMGFIFPTNRSLENESTARFFVPLLTWLLPDADPASIELAHILIRKAGHFFGYGFLAFLLFRAFRRGRKSWKPEWIVYSGIISFAYAALDEYVQAFLPLRTGQFSDWVINAAGVVCTLGIILLRRTQRVQA